MTYLKFELKDFFNDCCFSIEFSIVERKEFDRNDVEIERL